MRIYIAVLLTQFAIFMITWILAFGELGTNRVTKRLSWTNISLINLASFFVLHLPIALIYMWLKVFEII